MMRLWRREFVYEMMSLGLEVTPYRTLEHIVGGPPCGRHRRAALRRGAWSWTWPWYPAAPSATTSASSAATPGSGCRICTTTTPDQWFRRRKLTDIGHVAANHSVWDLELDYLSVESLLLIYADFRVKQTQDGQGREVTKSSPWRRPST